MNEAPKLPTLPPQGYGNDGWCKDDVLAFGLQCWKAGAAWQREQDAKLCKEYATRHAKDDYESKAQAWMMLQCAIAIRGQGTP